ncbi:hypothetical protein BD310DRAFT_915792 [Dichomitus squalens]|uniref:Uncharacterized protein n=1 Tax=Dichomitus squalens TaxID=114155 RepID=A0A4Q9Q8D7_9APHY|nr:hypothetical protein BD310DRAFT_915792 [Dichomitus squalens]
MPVYPLAAACHISTQSTTSVHTESVSNKLRHIDIRLVMLLWTGHSRMGWKSDVRTHLQSHRLNRQRCWCSSGHTACYLFLGYPASVQSYLGPTTNTANVVTRLVCYRVRFMQLLQLSPSDTSCQTIHTSTQASTCDLATMSQRIFRLCRGFLRILMSYHAA